MRRRKCVMLAGACVILIAWRLINYTDNNSKHLHSVCEPIDVVYTWVNGSDPNFIISIRQYELNYDPARFDDKQELRYSLRSLELFAPWIRHVYIVTNGQIPHWLDLTYERVTIIPHEVLASSAHTLPTFSSSAIETMLHNIPNLSKRFLYMNDDIFLGAPLYPDDLYTDADGTHIFNAWTVPDCATDCPWVYIGDGACDMHCNLAECQFDGGDCEGENINDSMESLREVNEFNDPKNFTLNSNFYQYKQRRGILIKGVPTPANHFDPSLVDKDLPFREIIKKENITTLKEIGSIVNKYNKQLKSSSQLLPSNLVTASGATQIQSASPIPTFYITTKDIYSQSLINTNMLLNRYYGFKSRNVPAHVGFLIDRDIITEMQSKFSVEFKITASHRFRAANDLQYAFMYYSYLMSETRNATLTEIFEEFDTDASLTWSDREIRTFLTRIYPLPLDWSAVRYFEEVIWNCSRNPLIIGQEISNVHYSTLVYERYEDSNVPTITRSLVENCEPLSEALRTNFANRPKYKFTTLNSVSKMGMYSNFIMLTSNVTNVVEALDRIRHKPKKFNCINDNLERQYQEDNELIRHLLEDFYLSFFPRRSKFELHEHYRNRFSNWYDYHAWHQRKVIALIVGYVASVCLLAFLYKFACLHKAKIVRRCVKKL